MSEDEVARLRAENERLREALKPFAAVASWPDVSEGACSVPIPDRYAMTWAVVTEAEAIDGGPTPTVGDCRRAAELLKEVGNDG